MGLLSLWRRRLAVIAALTPAVLTPTLAFAQIAAPAPAEAAKASMADGEKAAKAKDWKSAIASYDAANQAQPSDLALDSLANAYYQAGDISGAWSAYNEWTDKYAAKASATRKNIAATRLKELTDKTGGVVISVSETGATVLVDDKAVGTSPLPSQLRLTSGPHHVKVTKDGFIAFDQSPTVVSGTTTTVEAKLQAANAKQKITVTEKGNHPVRVIIDGIDRGPAPWTGDIEPGQHDVMVKGGAFVSPPQKVNVERDKPTQVDLLAFATSAPVKIATEDGKGSIYIDGQLVGQGTFAGELAGGTHEIKITRDGYDTLVQTIDIQAHDQINKTYSLTLSRAVQTEQIKADEDRAHGVYGGFGLVGFATPGGTGSSIEQQCGDAKGEIPTLTSCNTPGGLGAGVGGYFGYHWDLAGLELYAAGDYDSRKDTENWASAVATGSSADPARTENYTIRRYGAMGLVRVRFTKQWKSWRLTFPIGAGVSWRQMKLTRDARGTDGSVNVFSPDAQSYTSPVIQLEPTVAYRLTPGVAVTLGVQLLLESPASFLDGKNNPVTESSTAEKLGRYGLSTPPYTLAANAQIFIGPVIGMMFGP